MKKIRPSLKFRKSRKKETLVVGRMSDRKAHAPAEVKAPEKITPGDCDFSLVLINLRRH